MLELAGWLANVVHVKKKNGQIRVCVDFQDLNKACSKDKFPLLNVDILVDAAVGHECFSFMDGYSEYNQILIDQQMRQRLLSRKPLGITSIG